MMPIRLKKLQPKLLKKKLKLMSKLSNQIRLLRMFRMKSKLLQPEKMSKRLKQLRNLPELLLKSRVKMRKKKISKKRGKCKRANFINKRLEIWKLRVRLKLKS
jgi:hypothetical protein